ncbi:protein TOPAZ1-like isoform X1 [Scyliorhinus torazame]|uniref:protein TOPAZ1-like isoform X1 n=1 Tax=Scyliorhinus torazame TaxID=75743 RepID=UPI003B590A3C
MASRRLGSRPAPLRVQPPAPSPPSAGPKPGGCPRQLRRSTIEQRIKIAHKNLTERSPSDSGDVVMDHSIREPSVGSTKRLNCRSVQQVHFKSETEQRRTVRVQLCDYMMPNGLKQSSINDHYNQQCNDMCSTSGEGLRSKRCQARKREKDHGCRDCKVADVMKNNRRGTELIATIEPLQVSLIRNGCSKINPSEDLSKCIKQYQSKSAGMEFTTENSSKILLETGPSELSRVIQKGIQQLKSLDKDQLGTDAVAGDIEKTRTSKVTEACSEIGFKPGCLGLSWHPKGLVWQSPCQDSTAWSTVSSTNVAEDCLEEEIPVLPDDRTLGLPAGFEPVDIKVNEAVRLSTSCKRKASGYVHSEASVPPFGCARTTPITLDTCARARPFKRTRQCPEFWFGSEWYCKPEKTGELRRHTSVLDPKSGALPRQGYVESVECVLYLLTRLSLEVPEIKAANKDNLRNQSLLKNNCSCASFASDKVAKVQPSIHLSKYSSIVEYGKQPKDAHDCKTSASINVLDSKMANGLPAEETKYQIKQSKLNFTNSAVHCTKTLMPTQLPAIHVPLCNDTGRKAAIGYQRHETIQDKFTPRKVCTKGRNDIQSTVIPVHQKAPSELRCSRVDGQCHVEPSEQTESEGLVEDHSFVDVEENAEYQSKSVEVTLRPDGSAEKTPISENQPVLPSPEEPFIAMQIIDREVKEMLDRNAEEEGSSQRVPDVIRAYEEDVLVLDVIQDDPELFGSPSNAEVVQTEPSVGLDEATCGKAEFKPVEGDAGSELNSKQKESSEMMSSTFLCVSNDDVFGKLPNCANLQNGFKTSVSEESYFDEGAPLVKERERTQSEYNLYPIASSTGIVSEMAEQPIDRGTEISSLQYHCSDRRSQLENQFSPKQPYSEFPFRKLALTNDLRFPQDHLPPSACAAPPIFPNSSEHWTRPLELTALLPGYCRFYFTTVKGCKKKKCRFGHEVKKGDEKFCMEIVQKFLDTGKLQLLIRAVKTFRSYYRNFPPGIYCSSQVLNRLLFSLLNLRMLQEVFELLNMAVIMKVLPEGDILLNVFDLVASTDLKAMIPNLIEITCKLAEVGLKFQLDQFNYVIHLLNQLPVSQQEIHFIMALKPRLLSHQAEAEELFDFNFAIAEIEQYKEKGEWNKMGAFFQSLHWNDDTKSELHRIAKCIAITLVKSEDHGATVPFCEFAKAVWQKPHTNGLAKKLLVRIGTSVMVAYYKSEQWRKARKVLDTLQEPSVNFTVLKGLVSEFAVSRCQIINVAGEIFLKVGCVSKALWLLRESGWIISSPEWPCDKLDVLNRHNFLFSLADAALKSSMYCETLEVLQHLPRFQSINGTMDLSPYVTIFNNLLLECIQNNCLGVSTDTVEFMRSASIPVNSLAVRNLITALGRSCLWSKARKQYKKALSSGCYPAVEENLYRKLLPVPSFLSEVEMLLATEMFLVTNASNIQSPSVSKQSLQIVLRRYDDDRSQPANDDYPAAVDRLLAAARKSEPKLQIKHTTVNIAKEEVFSLEYSSALKWLEQNMKWAGKVWLFD